MRLAEELGVAERVGFAGFRTDVGALMSGVDLVVHTSTTPEPFGRVIVEGMLAGRPVVATRGGGVEEIVADAVTGLLVPPNDPAALVAAMRRLLEDPHFAESLAAAGRQSATERFSLDTTLRDISEVFRAVAK